ncbi:MAG: DEAD/DEAH box helicase [Synechococcales bacterium]|nr:DEAD/DEAH box helicase [Synechococcales bacterium]
MSLLHGCWLRSHSFSQPGGLFLWGETWRRWEPDSLTPHQPEIHPFAMTTGELMSLLAEKSNLYPFAIAGDRPVAESAQQRSPKRTSSRSQPSKGPSASTAQPLGMVRREVFCLPTIGGIPCLSNIEMNADSGEAAPESPTELFPWLVEGIWLPMPLAIPFLRSLPLGDLMQDEDPWLGDDLRFWTHMERWSLDLLARGKVLPTLGGDPLAEEPGTEVAGAEVRDQAIAQWQVLLDSATDQARLVQFTQKIPFICLFNLRNSLTHSRIHANHPETLQHFSHLAGNLEDDRSLLCPMPQSAKYLLLDFLNSAIAQPIQQAISPTTKTLPPVLQAWWEGLTSSQVGVAASDRDRLLPILQTWMAPLQLHIQAFRTCLHLHPPSYGAQNWRLDYGLQAIDDPNFWVPAQVIWQHPVEQFPYLDRIIDRPQETLLAGLGLASRLYPALEPSLNTARPQHCSLNPVQAYEFLRSETTRLQESGIGVLLPPSLANRTGWANRLGLKIIAATPKQLKKQKLGLQSLLNFQWQLSIGGHSLSKEEFDRLVALRTPLVEINGEWVELRPQDIKAAQSFFAARKDQTTLSLEDALRLSTGDTQAIEKLPVVSFEASGALQELVTTLTDNRKIQAIIKPQAFQGELRPYQALGVGWLAFLEQWGLGACLADDMGLGKTISLLAFLLHLQEQDKLVAPVLLVCPTSVLGNWEREAKRFAPTVKVCLHHGDRRLQGKAFAKQVSACHLVITSYALVHRDVATLKVIEWQGVVLDEAQNVKNAEAKQSQAVRQFPAQFRIALTGTPVENRLQELWAILDFLNPGYLGSKLFFQRRFAIPIERYGDTTSLQTLRSLAQPFILRRLKTDRTIIQDLPEKQEMTVFCGLTTLQAALYQQTVDDTLAKIDQADGIQRRGMILALLTKLKQICNHPGLFNAALLEDSSSTISPSTKTPKSSPSATAKTAKTKAIEDRPLQQESGKVQRLAELLEVLLAEGDRALIFTQFAEWGKLLQAYLQQSLGRETLFLYGSTPKKQREAMIDRFQNDPQGPRLFILSLKAGGVGLNLTRANHVFHFDRWWNPAVENQATDRVFRIGQTRNVQVHKFVCSGTLEERIHDMIESKKALAEQVVGTGENWLTDLDTDQLRNLLVLDRQAIINESNS